MEDGVADVQIGTGPVRFVHPVDAADEDVRTQTPDVAPERLDGAVGGDEQRQHVEAGKGPAPLETIAYMSWASMHCSGCTDRC